MTQGDPISPTIFNVVVEAVVRHWLTGVIADAEEQGELGKEGGHQLYFHDFLHGFREGHGTGAATLEAKLLQQLAALREEVLYVIFQDMHKTYDALDRSRCLEILEG